MATAELKTKGLTVQELAAEVTRRQDAMEDYISDTRRMGFTVTPDRYDEDGYVVELDDEQQTGTATLTLDSPDDEGELIDLPMNDLAQNQIAQRLGIPSRYWDRMRDNHPDVLQETVRKLLVREPSVRMVRALDGKARAYLSNRYRRLDYFALMERSILPALTEGAADGGMQVFSCALTDLRLYMKVIFPDTTVEIVPGQEVSCGIVIGNSEVGAGKLFVDPFTYSWACSNGTIFGQKKYSDFGLSKMHVGRVIEDNDAARSVFTDETMQKEDEAFFAMAFDVIKSARSGIHFAAIASRMREIAGIKVGGDPVVAVQRLAKTQGMTEDEQGGVMKHLIEGGDLSAWGYVNAITRMAQDVESYDRATDLERLAGDLLDLSASRWQALAEA